MSWDFEEEKKSYKKNEWMDLSEGTHVVRLIGEPLKVTVHAVGYSYVECLGDECPLCKVNRQLFVQYKKEASKQPQFTSQTLRFYTNALDKTMVKVCPNPECQKKVKASKTDRFPDNCPECNTVLRKVEPVPLNQVVVINVSKSLAKEFKDLEKNVRTEDEESILGLNNFDVELNVAGVKKERIIIPKAAKPLNTDPLNVPEDALFDLTSCYHKLTAEEMKEARFKKVSLKDIYAARRAESTADVELDVLGDMSDLEAQTRAMFDLED